jgi:hypothetical protein
MLPVNPTPEADYFAEIEQRFILRTGNAKIVIGHREYTQVDEWFRSGVSFDCVIRGIDLAFEEHRRRRILRPIKSLMYCKPWVEDLARKFGKVQNQEVGDEDSQRKHGATERDAATDLQCSTAAIREVAAYDFPKHRELQALPQVARQAPTRPIVAKKEMATSEDLREFYKTMREIAERKGLPE